MLIKISIANDFKSDSGREMRVKFCSKKIDFDGIIEKIILQTPLPIYVDRRWYWRGCKSYIQKIQYERFKEIERVKLTMGKYERD